jgi:NAD(P)-dependent dehydrogenase (short-subunit alcohol dehydrogenase family)
MELEGKICLVTGASRGIGRATAQALAARGAVVAASASGADRLQDLGAASIHPADLSDPAEAADLAADVLERHGRVDVLVNNAGVRLDALVHKIALEDLDRSFQVNALSPFVLCGALVPGMVERGEGVVANVVAPSVAPGRRGMGAYAASKAALSSLTSTLRMEVGGKGVAVFGFDPGWVGTDLAPDGPEQPEPVGERLVDHIAAAKGAREPLT